MSGKRVNLRIPDELYEELVAIQERKGLTLSEVVRDAVSDYVAKEAPSWNTETVEMRLPAALISEIEMLIRNQIVADIDQAGLLAFRDWCRAEEEHYSKDLPAAEMRMNERIERREAEIAMKRRARDMKKR